MAKVRKTSVMQRRPGKEADPAVNKYYLLVSDRYMRAKYVTVMILALFLAFMMILFRNDITYANLMYLLRDFNTGDAVYTAVFDPIRYDEQDNMSFAVYRGELAVIGNRSLRLYNSKGEENRSYEPGYADPVVISSDKYLLAYDIGSDSYSVFTSIAKVNEGTAEGNIEYADVNDNGDYLLVCRSTETKYLVCTYDSSFRPIANYYKNSYVTSAAIGNDGQTVIASFRAEDGGYNCEIEFFPDGTENPSNVYSTAGVFPVKCGVWDDGRSYVVCSDRILFFDDDGELTDSFESWSGFISYSAGEKHICVSRSDDAIGVSSEVLVFDTSGELLYNNKMAGKVSSVAISDESLFTLAGNTVSMIPISGGDIIEEKVGDGGAELLVFGSSAILCRKNGVQGLIFDPEELSVTTVSTDVTSD